MDFIKPKRIVCENYLDWVRTLPCYVTGQPNSEAHHVIGTGGVGAMGSKSHDIWAIPLSPEMHRMFHNAGMCVVGDEVSFFKEDQWKAVCQTIAMAVQAGVIEL